MNRHRSDSAARSATRWAWIGIAILLVACSTSPEASPTPAADDLVGRLMAAPYGPQSVDAAVSILAENGIATYETPESTGPMTPVAEPSVPFKFLIDQVRSMALEANVGGGTEGAELDAMVETEPDLAPPSFVLAAYVAAAETEGSALAQQIMGATERTTDEWKEAPSYLYPNLVIVLFTADVARDQMAEPAADAGQGAMQPAAFHLAAPAPPARPGGGPADALDPCTSISNFITASLKAIFDSLHLGEPKRGIARIFVKIWNFMVDILATVVSAIVDQFKQRVLDNIGRVAAIVGTLATVISAIRPWTVTVKPVPAVTEKGIAGIRQPDHGRLVSKVELGGLDEFPVWAVKCAEQAGRPLPSLKPEGTPITWQPLVQAPGGLVQEDRHGSRLDAQGASPLDYTTLIDDVEMPYRTVTGTIKARVSIERQSLRDLLTYVETNLWSELPMIIVGPMLRILGPSIESVKSKLGRLLTVAASGPATVLYHIQDATPTPSATARPTSRPAQPRCQTRCGQSNGDPHITTIDDTHYDFQVAGEFVVLRSADGTFEVQARQEPYPGSTSVSINTAIAMRVGARRLGLYADTASGTTRVTLDGVDLDTSQPVELDGGARITADYAGYEVTFADGTVLDALRVAQAGINLVLEPSEALATSASGIFGPSGPDSDLPAMPDGSVLPAVFGRSDFYPTVNTTFADAWRITDATSLFDYAPGTSTATFTIAGFPSPEDVLTIDDLTPEQRAAGEAACAGITNEMFHEQCVFDVAVTGDPSFAQIYDMSARLVETGSLKPGGESVRVVNLYQNENGPTALDVYAWSDAGAALIDTVEYGQAGAWFDPGVYQDMFQGTGNRISIQRQGEAALDAGLNLVDLARSPAPGAERTLLVTSSSPDSAPWVGGRGADVDELNEVLPGSPFVALAPAPADQGLLFVGSAAVWNDQPELQFFVSAGDGCLTQVDFPTLAQIAGSGRDAALAVAPGDRTLTFHAATGTEDPFAFRCDTASIIDPIPFTVAAGQRLHAFVYDPPGDVELTTLLLPFGD